MSIGVTIDAVCCAAGISRQTVKGVLATLKADRGHSLFLLNGECALFSGAARCTRSWLANVHLPGAWYSGADKSPLECCAGDISYARGMQTAWDVSAARQLRFDGRFQTLLPI